MIYLNCLSNCNKGVKAKDFIEIVKTQDVLERLTTNK